MPIIGTTSRVIRLSALFVALLPSYLVGRVYSSILESTWAVSPHRPLVYHEVIDANRRRLVKSTGTMIKNAIFPGEYLEFFPGSRRRDIEGEISEIRLINRVKMWPPWPLNLIQRDDHHHDKDDDGSRNTDDKHRKVGSQSQNKDLAVTAANTYPSAAALAMAWCLQNARIGLRQLQEVGSMLWFHLPPSLPPLLAVSCIPRSMETGRIIPLVKDPFVRTLVLGGFGVAVLSWAHQELHRKRRLTPLIGVPQPVSRVFLPPFLPDVVPEPEMEALQQSSNTDVDSQSSEDASQIFSMLSPRFRKHLSDIYESSPLRKNSDNPLRFRGFFKERKRKQEVRKREAAKIRRSTIFDQLVALQAIKRNSSKPQKSSSQTTGGESVPIKATEERGYALVTGASQGIGRALAVELARWEIPLVLVARDIDRLTSLAFDLEACYGVRCCVLQADLSQLDAPERIFETTQKAGLTIDILVNNAGIAYEGLSTDIETSLIEQMIVINTMSFAKLSKLYGQTMKERRRGRMLMVSSMAGMVSASPNTALYGATKAFEKSLSLSMSKEMETYGVGVTCIMPGPVTGTEFRSRNGSERALCWYIPFYPRPAETVAHQGIMSLLDGDTQVIPGWQNRVAMQLLRPVVPQRVETICVEAAWKPFHLPHWKELLGLSPPTSRVPPSRNLNPNAQGEKNDLIDRVSPLERESNHIYLPPRYNFPRSPRLLTLPVPPDPVIDIPPESTVPDLVESDATGISAPGNGLDAVDEIEGYIGPSNSQNQLEEDASLMSKPDLPIVGETSLEQVTTEMIPDPSQPPLTAKVAVSHATGSEMASSSEESTLSGNIGKTEQAREEHDASTVPAQALETRPKNPDEGNLYSTKQYSDKTLDDILTPRLGPIDLLRDSRPFTAFPNAKTDGRQKWNVEA